MNCSLCGPYKDTLWFEEISEDLCFCHKPPTIVISKILTFLDIKTTILKGVPYISDEFRLYHRHYILTAPDGRVGIGCSKAAALEDLYGEI